MRTADNALNGAPTTREGGTGDRTAGRLDITRASMAPTGGNTMAGMTADGMTTTGAATIIGTGTTIGATAEIIPRDKRDQATVAG